MAGTMHPSGVAEAVGKNVGQLGFGVFEIQQHLVQQFSERYTTNCDNTRAVSGPVNEVRTVMR